MGEIRTHEGVAPLAVFKTAAFNRSATAPYFNFVELEAPTAPHNPECNFRCNLSPVHLDAAALLN